MDGKSQYDVVVIGAGPAGAAAAYYCARGGCHTLLIDRAEFPREKTCGDGLMPSAVEAVRRMGAGAVRGHTLYGARFLHASDDSGHYEDFRTSAWPTPGLAVRRATLDNALLARARAAGAEFIVGKARRLLVTSDGLAKGVAVDTATGPRMIYAGTIVAASGSASSSFLGTKPSARGKIWGVAARTYVRLRQKAGHDLHLHFPLRAEGTPVSGYAWIFPVDPEIVNIGAGVIRTQKTRTVSPKRLLEQFISERVSKEERLSGAMRCEPIAVAPLGLTPITESPRGVLLAGDLAGLANPFTGEGIGAALDSGTLAAEAILSGDSDVNTYYRALIEERFSRKLGLESLVAATHGHPNFFLDRGCDLLLRPPRLVGSQVRTIIWDPLTTSPWWSRLQRPSVRSAADRTRTAIVEAARAIRPLFGALIDEATQAPGSSFGRYVTFGLASRPNHDETLPQITLEGLLIVEALRMVRELHWDLQRSRLRDDEWGCDAVGLVLADAVNAVVMKTLCRMEAAWASELTHQASQAMRCDAERATREMGANESVSSELYATAARLALGYGPSDALPPVIETAAARIEEWESTSRGSLGDWSPGASSPTTERLPESLVELFAVLDANARTIAPRRTRPMPRRRHVLRDGASGSAAE